MEWKAVWCDIKRYMSEQKICAIKKMSWNSSGIVLNQFKTNLNEQIGHVAIHWTNLNLFPWTWKSNDREWNKTDFVYRPKPCGTIILSQYSNHILYFIFWHDSNLMLEIMVTSKNKGSTKGFKFNKMRYYSQLFV